MRAARIAVALLVTGSAACSSGSQPASAPPTTSSSPTTPTSPTATDTPTSSDAPVDEVASWPTYHGSADRAGAVAVALRPPLRVAWRVPVDAALYAQPISAAGLAFAATENNTVLAVDVVSGRVKWRRHLDAAARRATLPCGNIDPSGITGTPAYDAATHQLFVVTENADARHTLVALDSRTGKVRWRRNVDVAAGRDPHAEQERGALLVASGHVYVPFGGRYGDCGNYVGYVAAVALDGTGPTLRYEVPTAREAGIWAAPGPVIGPGGDLYVASGNGAETGGHYDGSDSVIRLTPSLRRVAVWAPSTWPQDNADDLDLGSMSPVPLPQGILIAGKRGVVYLLRADLRSEVAHLSGCASYGGAAASAAATVSVVVLPCNDGLRAVRVQGQHLSRLWHNGSMLGSPAIAGDAVYGFDGSDLVEASLTNGHVHARVHVGDVTRFATPAPVGPLVLVGTTSELVAVRGGP